MIFSSLCIKLFGLVLLFVSYVSCGEYVQILQYRAGTYEPVLQFPTCADLPSVDPGGFELSQFSKSDRYIWESRLIIPCPPTLSTNLRDIYNVIVKLNCYSAIDCGNRVGGGEIGKYIRTMVCYHNVPNPKINYLSEGQYLVAYVEVLEYYPESIPIPPFYVKECAPGTWSTCNDTSKCSSPIPKTEESWKPGPNMKYFQATIDHPKLVLVEKCYDCDMGIGFGHYEYPGNVECNGVLDPQHPKCMSKMLISSLAPDKDRQYVCYGGASPPMFCPRDSFANSQRTACECAPGTFSSGSICAPCPIAHYCINGKATLCTNDTYNSQIGQSACQDCLTANQNCLPGLTLAKCSNDNDPKGHKYITRPTCVPCLQCKHNVLSSDKYRDLNQEFNFKSTPAMYVDCYEDPM